MNRKKIATIISLFLLPIVLVFTVTYLKNQDINNNIKLLKSEEHADNEAGIRNLVVIGKPAVRPLIFEISKNDSIKKSSVLEFISYSLNNDKFYEFRKQLDLQNYRLKLGAVKVLGEIGDPQAIPVIKSVITDNDRTLNYEAMEALRKIGAPAVSTIISLMNYNSYFIKECSIEILGESGTPEAAACLVKFLKGNDWYLKDKAVSALIKIGSPSVEFIIEGLRNKDPEIQALSVFILGKIGDKQAVEALIEVLNNKENESFLRVKSMEVLRKIGDKKTIAPIIKCLQDEDEEIRFTAIETLGQYRCREAIEPLHKLIKDKNPLIRDTVADTISLIEQFHR